MRVMLWSLLVSVLVAFATGTQARATLASHEARSSFDAPGGSLVAPSTDQLIGGEGSRAARAARRTDPRAIAARRAARTRFENLSPARSSELARAVFPALVEDPAGGAPRLGRGQRIVHYRTAHAAEVSLAGGEKGVIESLTPIAGEGSNGRDVPLNLSLRRAGDRFEPIEPSVGVHLPSDLSEGVSLPELGVSMAPVNRQGSPLSTSAGSLQGATVLWAGKNAPARGVDDLAELGKPTPAGFDMTSMLLSQRSPRSLFFRVGMPAGARLATESDGSVRIVKGRAVLATIIQPSAEDAEGASVPVRMTVRGDLLDLSVDLGGDYLYPVAVDPEVEANDSQLADTTGHKRSNWEFHTSNAARFQGHVEAGVERLETKGISAYTGGDFAYWAYQTKGVSHIYEIKTETSAKNKAAKIESYLEFQEPGGVRETRKTLSTEFENPEYERKATTACAANASKVEECLPGSGKAGNAVQFEQAATASPGNYAFSDSLTQGIVSIAEPSGTHSKGAYNTSSPTIEVEVEGKKVSRVNALRSGANTWLAKLPGTAGGAIELQASDPGIGVSSTKLEYESASGIWTPLEEHNYLAEGKCQGLECYAAHGETWTLVPLLPDGAQKLRYKAHEAISGTESLTSEGQATVKVDTTKPHGLRISGLPFDGELSERPYQLTVLATDGEGSTVASSGIKSIALYVDGHELATAGGACTVVAGECTASNKWTINGAELGAGTHGLQVVALDNAGNEARYSQSVAIRHSAPVALGPGSVDLQSGDFALGAADVSLGSGLTVERNYTSRATTEGGNGPLGPEWSLSLGNTESLEELSSGDVLQTAADGRQTIFAALGSGKFESPPGDANLELSLEENKTTKEKLAYYLKDPAKHSSVKFARPAGVKNWVPTSEEGTVASDTVTYSYNTAPPASRYPLPGGEHPHPEGLAAGPDGNMWLVEHSAGKVAKVNSVGTITSYSLPAGSEPGRITAGPDGNMWFTSGKKLGKITPSGKVAEYSTSSPESGAGGIATGSNGFVWYTEPVSRSISMISTSGTSSVKAILPAGAEPTELAEGPDGNIWFVDGEFSTLHRIGKITPSNVVTEYALPEGSNPVDITAGPGNSMWFTIAGTQKIGRITMAGEISEYVVPAGTGAPNHIAAGRDGNVWFTTAKAIGKITPSGEVTEYGVGTEHPIDIAAGADGNLWFTDGWRFDTSSEAIDSLTPPGTGAEPSQVLAPAPAGVSCAWTSRATEMHPGCRALEFRYGQGTYARGPARSEWGEFAGRLSGVVLVAYNPASKQMEEKEVAKYQYDSSGRLRSEYRPGTSPALETTYGYDAEGHVTSLTPPGREPWTFTYGATAADTGLGRLIKVSRAPASSEPWKGEAVASTEAPKISGSAIEGARLSVSSGKWSGSPNSYSYQWQRCTTPGACAPIPGATNANYTAQAADVGDTLVATVAATNGDGTVSGASTETAVAKTLASSATEYAVPAGSQPTSIAAGPEAGTLWFADTGSSKIGKVTSSGTVTEYALPAGSAPEAIAKGPDGNMWFVDSQSNKVGKITPGGAITAYALPAGSRPRGIVAGPDGNLWFTDYTSSKVGKITTSGAITEFALGSLSEAWGIAVGSDGNLWVGERTKIAKITTTGAVTEYAVKGGARGVAAGPDGNLWFAGHSETDVGEISASGTVTEYPVSGFEPEYVTSIGESLWVTSRYSNHLYRSSTSGAITAYTLPSGSQPSQMTVNSLGETWYAEANDKLARLSATASEGAARAPEPGATLNYEVPVVGASAPHEMSAHEVARWGQSDDPVEATAITAADEPQSWPATSYKRASVYYLDERGRQVDVAAPSSLPYGSIATTEYNEFNDVIRSLTPDNRVTALEAGAASPEKSKLLDTQYTFNGEGAKEAEVPEAGTRLIESLGPQHMIKYVAGHEQKESLARDHKELSYDQGAPSGEAYDLVTESSDLALLANKEDVEVRTTKTSYSGQSNLGWKLRAPTSVTVDPTGTHGESVNLTTTTEYDPATAQITEVRGAGAGNTFSYATKFGEAGAEPGKLQAPWGDVVNSEGNLLVADSANNRIEKFSPAGTYISAFGEAGSGNGQLKEPQGIALDAVGHIWVADTGNNRIEEFSAAGAFMATVGSLGSESGKLKAPSDLAFDAKGNLWVADTGNSRIEKFDKEAKFASEFGSLGSEPGKLKEPRGIAVDSGEDVWVADTANNRIEEFSTTGSLLRRVGSPGAGEGQLNTPTDLRIDGAGNIWTADSLNNRAEAFASNGTYVTQIGWQGAAAGQLSTPRGLAFDASGKVWVTDSSDNRLEQWAKGPNAHDRKTVYYGAAANGEYPACGNHPEWSGLLCEALPSKQPELMGLPKLPVATYTYNIYDEPETTTETFGSSTRTRKEAYDAIGRRASSETTASSGASLPKVSFEYNKESGTLERETTAGEEKSLTSEYNRLGQLVKYSDADGNVANYRYAGPEKDLLLEEATDSSDAGTSKQSYEYDPTTKLRTKLIDSAAGSFTASYDAEGKMTSVAYPYAMCADYAYNAVGEATSLKYLKTSNCGESEPGVYYSDTLMPSVRGEMLSQSSTLASETYTYDTSGRLSETQETPAGEGCTVRAYAYDEEGNRASLATRAPGGGGVCQGEGGTVAAHNYDEANRLADGGIAYDAFGNVNKLPAADAEGHELTSSFYVDNAVASQTQSGVTNEYKLDPEGRTRETITGSTKTKSHYDGSGATVAWSENAEQWVRNIQGLDGALLATQTNGATPILQLHDLQGDVIGTIGDKAGEAKLLSSYNSTEFGVPIAGKAPPKLAWLGAADVESSLSSGVITYGATSYVPQTGRALQDEAVAAPGLGGGSGSGAAYTMQEEPWVMQGAARSAAEAPGLEAAREREAFSASFVDPWVQHFYNLKEAESLAESFFEGESTAVVLSMFDLPDDFLTLLGRVTGDAVSQFDDAYKWLYDAGEKLRKCAGNNRGLHHCRFEYDQNEWEPGLFGIHPLGKLTWPNFSVEPTVFECKFFSTGGHECPNEVYIKTEL
jgi:streptogramin lyase